MPQCWRTASFRYNGDRSGRTELLAAAHEHAMLGSRSAPPGSALWRCACGDRERSRSHSRPASGLRLGYNITISTPPEPMSATLTNAEKQARYVERHLGVDGEKVRVGLNLNAGTR